ncbi:MAG: hypothetical protein V3W41_02675 [Planctomycetota bacterium]
MPELRPKGRKPSNKGSAVEVNTGCTRNDRVSNLEKADGLLKNRLNEIGAAISVDVSSWFMPRRASITELRRPQANESLREALRASHYTEAGDNQKTTGCRYYDYVVHLFPRKPQVLRQINAAFQLESRKTVPVISCHHRVSTKNSKPKELSKRMKS